MTSLDCLEDRSRTAPPADPCFSAAEERFTHTLIQDRAKEIAAELTDKPEQIAELLCNVAADFQCEARRKFLDSQDLESSRLILRGHARAVRLAEAALKSPEIMDILRAEALEIGEQRAEDEYDRCELGGHDNSDEPLFADEELGDE